jgi:hypothetical protein
MHELRRLNEIYKAGLIKLEKAPDFKYKDLRKKKTHHTFHDRGLEPVQVVSKAKI